MLHRPRARRPVFLYLVVAAVQGAFSQVFDRLPKCDRMLENVIVGSGFLRASCQKLSRAIPRRTV
jgi:hypothetical protein